MIDEFGLDPHIKVIGVGGGGIDAVGYMIAQGARGLSFICADTDAQALSRSGAPLRIRLGASGLDGAGADPRVGKAAALQAEEGIRQSIAGAHMLFIIAAMGGGTGTGAAPVIARLAKAMGILAVGVVTMPLLTEGARCAQVAEAGLAELEASVGSLIVVPNDRLLEMPGGNATPDHSFAQANDALKNVVAGIGAAVDVPCLVAVDFEDVMLVMSQEGKAMLGMATAAGPDRATKAAELALACPLLEGVALAGARGVLVLIEASCGTLQLADIRDAMQAIRRVASESASLIYGTTYDESLGDQLRVTVIATGLMSPDQVGSAVSFAGHAKPAG